MLYHLGRWVYLIDAADDLQKTPSPGIIIPWPCAMAAGRQMGRGEPPGLCQNAGPLHPHDRHGL
ncbi:MAG: hypothetical protein ACLTYN_15325 [Dysosmobacter welbionis]